MSCSGEFSFDREMADSTSAMAQSTRAGSRRANEASALRAPTARAWSGATPAEAMASFSAAASGSPEFPNAIPQKKWSFWKRTGSFASALRRFSDREIASRAFAGTAWIFSSAAKSRRIFAEGVGDTGAVPGAGGLSAAVTVEVPVIWNTHMMTRVAGKPGEGKRRAGGMHGER